MPMLACLLSPGTVDDAAHDGNGHVFYTGILLVPLRHLLAQVGLYALRQCLEVVTGCSAATGAGDNARGEGAHAEGLQQFPGRR